jgi:hypothetical protein
VTVRGSNLRASGGQGERTDVVGIALSHLNETHTPVLAELQHQLCRVADLVPSGHPADILAGNLVT